jgi:peptidoglycan/LPS O-acetylase OafA/YrhL
LYSETQAPNPAENGRLYFPALTGLRAIAAGMVFFKHFPLDKPFPSLAWTKPFTMEMHVGVTIFFVLSGFLISYRYKGIHQLNFKWFRNYFINRVARIYPIYFLATLGMFIFYPIHYTGYFEATFGEKPWKYVTLLFLNLSFLRGFSKEYIFSLVAQGWSLTVEECFYFTAPLILIFLRRRNIGYSIFWLLGLYATGLGCIFFFQKFPVSDYKIMFDLKFVLSFTFLGRAFEFLAGLVLGIGIEKLRNRLTNFPLLGIVGTLGFLGCVFYLTSIHEPGKVISGIHTYRGILVNNLVLPIFILAILVSLIFEKSLIRKLLETPLFTFLGKSSYTFYLIHFGFVEYILSGLLGLPYLLVFVALWLVSSGIYYYIEEPLNHQIRKLAKN